VNKVLLLVRWCMPSFLCTFTAESQ